MLLTYKLPYLKHLLTTLLSFLYHMNISRRVDHPETS